MSTLLQVTDITKVYKNQPKPGLDHVSFDVEQGEFLGIMGASGSGKTTLLNVLSTIDVPTSGNIIMWKTHIEKLGQKQAADFRKNNLGFIFQEYNLLDNMSLEDNIALPLALNGVKSREVEMRVRKMADMFGLGEHLKKYPYQLSGGQKQRGASARALVTEPEILFADEPTGALDSRSSRELLISLKNANDSGRATILMVTHDAYAASYAKQVYFLADGQIQCRLVRKEDRKEFYEKILDLQISMGGERE